MAGSDKEIGAQGLENYLNQKFPENNHISILMAYLKATEKKLEENAGGEKNPFFYAEFRSQIETSGDTNLENWVDSKGNVNISQISNVVKIAKKEFQKRKEQEEKNKESKSQLEQQIKEAELKQQIEQIDVKNLQIDDLLLISSNFSDFMEQRSFEDVKEYIETSNEFLGTAEKYAKIIQVYVAVYKNGEPKQEDIEWLKDNLSESELEEFKIDMDNPKSIQNDTVKKLVYTQQEVVKRVAKLIQLKGEITDKDIEELKEIYTDFPELVNEEELKDHANDKEYFKKKENELDLSNNELEIDNSKSKFNVTSEEEMQEENDALLDELMEMQVDFFDMDQEFGDVFPNMEEELVTDTDSTMYQNDEVNKIEEASEEIGEEVPLQEDLEQEEYEAPTFEEEKTGIAKFFETIKNLRPVQAIRKVFAPREEQKKLNAPTSQRTENGVRYTEYEENGSLLPMNIRARNFVRDFSLKAVEVITNGINNLTGGNKQEDVVINRPTVIKTMEENTPEQAQEIEQQNIIQPESIRNATNLTDKTVFSQNMQKRDDNPWAVATRSDMEEIAKAQTEKNDEGIEFDEDKKIANQDEVR